LDERNPLSHKIEQQAEEFFDLVNQMKFKLYKNEPGCEEEYNMTLGQFFTGWILRNHGSMKMSELAEKLRTSLSTATGLIDRMVKGGHVERERVDTDRRLVKIQLTRKGQQVVDKFHKQKLNQFRSMLSALNEKERVQYLKLVKKLVEGLDKETSVHNL
jgi:DNA-binding MarR family transcriptional regulator